MNRIAEVKARLEAATPGPWAREANKNNEFHPEVEWTQTILTADEEAFICIAEAFGEDDKDNFELIANAPSDIAFLLALAEKYEKALEVAIEAFDRLSAHESECYIASNDYSRHYDPVGIIEKAQAEIAGLLSSEET